MIDKDRSCFLWAPSFAPSRLLASELCRSPAKEDRGAINYQAPGHPALEPLAKILKEKQVLARVRQLLFPAELATPSDAPDVPVRASFCDDDRFAKRALALDLNQR
jgi:hypothetical protein